MINHKDTPEYQRAIKKYKAPVTIEGVRELRRAQEEQAAESDQAVQQAVGQVATTDLQP